MIENTAWCHNGYYNAPADDVARRARLAAVDTVIVKYGDPSFERAIAATGLRWASERFAYAADAAAEGGRLADAVDAGATFAVANCEPNDGGGWDAGEAAAVAMRALVATFRTRYPSVPLWVAADLRPGRGLGAPFVRAAAEAGVSGWMAMVYPGAFRQPVPAAFDSAYPGPAYLGLPCLPLVQAFDGIGPDSVAAQVVEARRRGAPALSLYVLEAATDAELQAFAQAKGPPVDLRDVRIAYLAGALAILDRGTAAELREWGALFAGSEPQAAAGAQRPQR
ncbi:MAG: hypothetical protein HYX50_02240 [Chloroflexi bacterium]|nr:hypothetical protein [Chloroflexota bacterium]